MGTDRSDAVSDAEIARPQVPAISAFLKSKNIPASAVVRANGWVYVSGLPPVDLDTGEYELMPIDRQTRIVIERMKLCLEAAGSSLDKVVKCNVYCSNAAYFQAVNQVYAEYFAENPPARVFLCTAGWFGPFDIEIDCVALA